MKFKQNRWRLFIIFFCFVVLCSSLLVSAITVTGENKPGSNVANTEPTIDEMILSQAQAVEASEILMQYFFKNYGALKYPDYFCGCYIEDNMLHIRLVSPSNEETVLLKSILKNYESVTVFEYGGYSQTALKNYADEIVNKLKNQGIEVAIWYVSDKTGNIHIGVLAEYIDAANDMIEKIKPELFSSPYPEIIIEEGSYTIPASTTTF